MSTTNPPDPPGSPGPPGPISPSFTGPSDPFGTPAGTAGPAPARPLALDGPAWHRVIARPSSVPAQILRALARLPFRSQGVLAGGEAQLGPIVVEQRAALLEPRRIALYREVCGYDAALPAVPGPFLETLFHPLMVELALSPAFPFSPLGLIHVRQRIAARQPLAPGARLDLRCSLAELRTGERGYEVDCAFFAEQAGEPVWEGVATLLSRNAATRRRKHGAAGGAAGDGPAAAGAAAVAAQRPWPAHDWRTIEVAASTGRRYAAASGDYNPHHLYSWTARPLGYKRPIVQGMWTLARALAELERQLALPAGLQLDVAFKRPVLMPARVVLRWREEEPAGPAGQGGGGEGGGGEVGHGRSVVAFEVRDASLEVPHLVGRLCWG